jgi:hypothetical protein
MYFLLSIHLTLKKRLHVKSLGIKYKTLRDGDTIIVST